VENKRKCLLCGRRLTDPKSKKLGFGRVCLKKLRTMHIPNPDQAELFLKVKLFAKIKFFIKNPLRRGFRTRAGLSRQVR